jgi:hypothetical protein
MIVPSMKAVYIKVRTCRQVSSSSSSSSSSTNAAGSKHVLSLQQYNEYWAATNRTIASTMAEYKQDVAQITQLENMLKKDTSTIRALETNLKALKKMENVVLLQHHSKNRSRHHNN